MPTKDYLKSISEIIKMDPDVFLKTWTEAKILPADGGEGSCVPDQMRFFYQFLMKNKEIKNILEIGFNAGLSSGVFLSTRPDISVISVDIGAHDYVLPAQKLIQKMFPDSFLLIVGDSSAVLPQLKDICKPDLIFIDGAHTEPTVSKDIENSLGLCKPGTWLLIDDYWAKGEHEPDVKKAVDKFITEGKMCMLGSWAVKERSWCVCKKVF